MCYSQQYAITNFLFLFFKITVLKTIVASKNYILKKNCIELHEKYTQVDQPIPCKHWRARTNTWSTQKLLFRTWLWHVWEENRLLTNCFRIELNYLVATKYQNRFVYAKFSKNHCGPEIQLTSTCKIMVSLFMSSDSDFSLE